MSLPLPRPAQPVPEPDPQPDPQAGSEPVLRLSGPGAVVQAIPYLVGFPPVDSVVVVALSADRRRLVLTVRADLAHDPVGALGPVWQAAVDAGAAAVLLTVHVDVRRPPLPWQELVTALTGEIDAAGLQLLDALCVGPDRYWSYRCADGSCCPEAGRPVQPDGPVAAELVLRGRAPVARREDLAAEVGADPERSARVRAAVERRPPSLGTRAARRAAGLALLDGLVRRRDAVPLDDPTAAEALHALTDLWVRDSQLVRRTGPEGERAAALWLDLARAAPPSLRAAPLTLLAVAWFARGDGARANVALDAALAADPTYAMADLVARAVAAAWSPAELCGTLDGAAREVRLKMRIRPRGC